MLLGCTDTATGTSSVVTNGWCRLNLTTTLTLTTWRLCSASVAPVTANTGNTARSMLSVGWGQR
jgi:hypothetical protein